MLSHPYLKACQLFLPSQLGGLNMQMSAHLFMHVVLKLSKCPSKVKLHLKVRHLLFLHLVKFTQCCHLTPQSQPPSPLIFGQIDQVNAQSSLILHIPCIQLCSFCAYHTSNSTFHVLTTSYFSSLGFWLVHHFFLCPYFYTTLYMRPN